MARRQSDDFDEFDAQYEEEGEEESFEELDGSLSWGRRSSLDDDEGWAYTDEDDDEFEGFGEVDEEEN